MGRHPLLPPGVTPIEFGQKIIKWGRGEEALKRIETISIEELRSGGVDCDMAKAWRDMYRQWAILHPGNPSAGYRAQLMNHIVALLEAEDV
jgi:hypothetical protein